MGGARAGCLLSHARCSKVQQGAPSTLQSATCATAAAACEALLALAPAPAPAHVSRRLLQHVVHDALALGVEDAQVGARQLLQALQRRRWWHAGYTGGGVGGGRGTMGCSAAAMPQLQETPFSAAATQQTAPPAAFPLTRRQRALPPLRLQASGRATEGAAAAHLQLAARHARHLGQDDVRQLADAVEAAAAGALALLPAACAGGGRCT